MPPHYARRELSTAQWSDLIGRLTLSPVEPAVGRLCRAAEGAEIGSICRQAGVPKYQVTGVW